MSFFKPDWLKNLKNAIVNAHSQISRDRGEVVDTALQNGIHYQDFNTVSAYVRSGVRSDQLDKAVDTIFDHKDMSPRTKEKFVRLFIENGANVSMALKKAKDKKYPPIEKMILDHVANGGRRKPQELPEARALSGKKRGMLTGAARRMLPAPSVQDKDVVRALPSAPEVDNTRKLNS